MSPDRLLALHSEIGEVLPFFNDGFQKWLKEYPFREGEKPEILLTANKVNQIRMASLRIAAGPIVYSWSTLPGLAHEPNWARTLYLEEMNLHLDANIGSFSQGETIVFYSRTRLNVIEKGGNTVSRNLSYEEHELVRTHLKTDEYSQEVNGRILEFSPPLAPKLTYYVPTSIFYSGPFR